MLSSINRGAKTFIQRPLVFPHNRLLKMQACIGNHRYSMLSPVGQPPTTGQQDDALPYSHASWVLNINRLMGAEMRPSPRPKPGQAPRLKHWNQEDLAVASGVTGNTLSDILRGKRQPGIASLEAIASALGTPAFVLLMNPADAERYAQFVAGLQAEDTATTVRESAHEIVASLVPEITALIERRMQEKKPVKRSA
jgi:transcriptional regulator with XRE-family HTH domain